MPSDYSLNTAPFIPSSIAFGWPWGWEPYVSLFQHLFHFSVLPPLLQHLGWIVPVDKDALAVPGQLTLTPSQSQHLLLRTSGSKAHPLASRSALYGPS